MEGRLGKVRKSCDATLNQTLYSGSKPPVCCEWDLWGGAVAFIISVMLAGPSFDLVSQ